MCPVRNVTYVSGRSTDCQRKKRRSADAIIVLRSLGISWKKLLSLPRVGEDRRTPPPRDALARARPVGEPGVARAIGQAFDRRVAAETEILVARGADRPAASLLAKLEQRA